MNTEEIGNYLNKQTPSGSREGFCFSACYLASRLMLVHKIPHVICTSGDLSDWGPSHGFILTRGKVFDLTATQFDPSLPSFIYEKKINPTEWWWQAKRKQQPIQYITWFETYLTPEQKLGIEEKWGL